jgi:hypothetical protein
MSRVEEGIEFVCRKEMSAIAFLQTELERLDAIHPVPFPLIFLDVVSVNPSALLRAIASFKEDILVVLASQ